MKSDLEPLYPADYFTSRGKLLEVGCLLGFLLDGVRRYSSREVTGLYLARFATFFAKRQLGLDVRSGTLEDAAFDDASFDFVVQKDCWSTSAALASTFWRRPGS